jgi:very-short-patch-repair endonuclease
MSPANHLKGQGCPVCHSSLLENDIKTMLDKHCIKYYFRYRKLDFLNGMELDFYLPEYKIAIECQGIQHFTPVAFFGGEKAYNEVKQRDLEKMKLCIKHNIKMLYYSNLDIEYPYKVFKTPEEIFDLIAK